MQKFFESTLVSTYIKYLLANTPLPLYPTIQTGDMLIAGMTYIYKKDINSIAFFVIEFFVL